MKTIILNNKVYLQAGNAVMFLNNVPVKVQAKPTDVFAQFAQVGGFTFLNNIFK